MKMGCVVKGHFIEMPINQSLDIFMTKTIHQYEHFYKSGRKKSAGTGARGSVSWLYLFRDLSKVVS